MQLLTVAAAVAATAAAASPLHEIGSRPSPAAVERAVASVQAPTATRLVWEGADVDGDGKADFANPTGEAPRDHDSYGNGGFGASRDGGSRRHEGVDFRSEPGQTVQAPISGYVTKIGYAYEGDRNLQFVEITNPAIHYAARVFYIAPDVSVGDTVAIGQPIGAADSLQKKYPGGMTNHVHLELIDKRGRRVDATRVLVAEYKPIEVAAAD